ncbi:unnamed protein product [Paramecium octaurelia]|uniref:Uncharacterized protein n=1 Tax=Paramecium octaurelia TaxID=43137 RepID=A0A8S1XII9_PAROT|nr:unnamed protein product [Paramecium octaurelia]CAD8201210.1 unnamed protein product [Paramecium octaurelia]
MNLLAQEKTSKLKVSKMNDVEKYELQMIIAKGKSQLSDLEKAYTIQLRKVQQSNFEEQQTKLKNQAKDINEKGNNEFYLH